MMVMILKLRNLRLEKSEANKNKPLKVILQSSNKVEVILRNVKKVKQSDEWKHAWINRCLTKEDKDKLRKSPGGKAIE